MALTFRKDGLIAQYAADSARLHAVEGVALGGVVLATLGFIEGTLAAASLGFVLCLGVLAVGAAAAPSHRGNDAS